VRQEQRNDARINLAGLVSDLKYKTAESIACRHDQQRHGLRYLVGSSTWEHRLPLRELAGRVGRATGPPDGFIVFAPLGLRQESRASVRVQRLWLWRLDMVDDGQIGVFMAYDSYHEHAPVDVWPYLPEE